MKTFRDGVRLVLLISSAAMMGSCGTMPGPMNAPRSDTAEENKRIVMEFSELAFKRKQFREAFEKYVVEDYIQHNPRVPDGREAAIKFLSGVARDNPQWVREDKRFIAEGDVVVIHTHSRLKPEDRGSAIVDILRLKNGKIVEHWDVIQPIPEQAANKNTMF